MVDDMNLDLFVQAQLDDTAVRLAAQEAAFRGSQQKQQLAALRAQLNALQHAPISGPAPAQQASAVTSPGKGIGLNETMHCNQIQGLD